MEKCIKFVAKIITVFLKGIVYLLLQDNSKLNFIIFQSDC